MSLFLTSEELIDLTGYQVAFYQARWLEEKGYLYDLNAFGKPRVLRSYVEQRLGLANGSPLKQTEPDFSAWK